MARYGKTIDEIRNEMLTDVTNQDDTVDVSLGSIVFIILVAVAAAIWGVYQFLNYVLDQIHPDTSDEANLERHAADYGITRLPGETAEALLARVEARKAAPPAGGNVFDYRSWALSVAGVAAAVVYPTRRGGGTVDVVIVADPAENNGSEIPPQELLDAVFAVIDPLRPAGMAAADPVAIVAAAVDEQDVTIATVGNGDLAGAGAEITAFLAGFAPGQILYPAQLQAIVMAYGFDNAVATLPAAPVEPDFDHMLRAGVISVGP